MSNTTKDVPEIEWPEGYGPQEGDEVVAKILGIIRESCHLDMDAEGICMVFVPDPPKSANSEDWIKNQCADELVLSALTWGNQGLAYVCSQRQYFNRLIAVFLSMGSTTLAILAIKPMVSHHSFEQQIPQLIESFMSNHQGGSFGAKYAGLFFDMGVLRDIHVEAL